MRLIPDVERVLKRAWSLRLIELAALVDIIINVVPYVSDYLPWWLTLALLGGAWTARLTWQSDGDDKQIGGSNADKQD
ncbi:MULTISPECIES: hypothetical protein [unclassified Mesorhizobium]|uniref:DUF7940 domain-containing protein n=1 Tax=unclassified Mesorhizobium TaxID=325217 RepID=UPI000F764E29|nr:MULTISPECIES: hypothetical protein [unclassified Mesorhizobium]AZO54872.1 hypothetical protein EJ077_16500 [Mesorhizobium sp. M8A.F.Ca.ET.057.01.1.1]RWE44146.1 MAG: hypothetical protein EOS80_19565 [Mesorhizobium sp.]